MENLASSDIDKNDAVSNELCVKPEESTGHTIGH
jgi:hypothetical protein